jgi:polysaccharide biosynthesis/export protein
MMFIGLYHKLRLFLVFLVFLNFLFTFLVGCGGKQTVNYQHMDPPLTKDSQSEKFRGLMLQSPMMKNVDPDADYIIGPDDVLDIEVFEVEELKKTVRVTSQGYVSLPLIGQVKAKGLTPIQIEQEIARKLDKYLNEPLVSVYVKEYKAQRIGVIGAVDKPQVYMVTGQRYLLDMLSMAGGLVKDAGSICYVLRPLNHDKQDISGTETLVIDLKELLEKGNLALNIPVFNGDVINVPKGGVVFVDGAVNKPGALQMDGKITVVQAIVIAGGIKYEANQSDVKIFRDTGEGTREVINVDYDAIKKGRQSDVQIKENDIIIVPKSGFKTTLVGIGQVFRGFFSFGTASVGVGY